MLLRYHRSDYHQLPNEDKFMALLRPDNLKPGLYVFPYCLPKDMKSPAALEKYKQGPVGHLNIIPSGPPALPKFLGLWFGFCLVIGFFVAYLRCPHTSGWNSLPRSISRRGYGRLPGLRFGKP